MSAVVGFGAAPPRLLHCVPRRRANGNMGPPSRLLFILTSQVFHGPGTLSLFTGPKGLGSPSSMQTHGRDVGHRSGFLIVVQTTP